MKSYLGALATAALIAATASAPAAAEKAGCILKMYRPDSPASMSIHEEATFVAEGPDDGRVRQPGHVFDQHVKQNSLASKAPTATPMWSGLKLASDERYQEGTATRYRAEPPPDLATGWSWKTRRCMDHV